MVDDKIVYMSIWLRGRINSDDPGHIKLPEYNKWQTWIETHKKTAPKELQSMF